MNIKGIFVLSIALITAMIVLIGTCQACGDDCFKIYDKVEVGTLNAFGVSTVNVYTNNPEDHWVQVPQEYAEIYSTHIGSIVNDYGDGDYTQPGLDACFLISNDIYSNDINVIFMHYVNLYPLVEPEPVAPAETSGDGMPKMCLRGMRSGTETARMELGLSFNYDLVEPGLWGDHPLYQRCYENGYQKTMNILG